MSQAYWFFVVYVSPVLLVAVCGYLVWRAVQDTRKGRKDGPDGKPAGRGPGTNPPEREPWEADPDAWKGDG